jgi:hypothetical protein
MNSNKEQTTVDWIEQEMLKGNLSLKEILEQAKEMEKERIIKAYNQDLIGGLSGYRKFNDGEDYYNETYGGNK